MPDAGIENFVAPPAAPSLREALAQRRWTAYRLAHELGLPLSTVYGWVNAEATMPQKKHRDAIRDLLGPIAFGV